MRDRDRHVRLLQQLRADGHTTVADLSEAFGVTPSTIRRDLQQLARDGRLVRTYGGATVGGAGAASRIDPMLAAKRRIAAAAAPLVADGSTIAIGSGTTALEFARAIADRRLTVITNAMDVATALLDRPGIELIVLGGVVRPVMHSMLGHLAELAARELRADTFFMGIGAISLEQGLMNDYVPEILTDRALHRMARSVVVLADSTKFDEVAPGFLFGLDEVDAIVTDDAVDSRILDALRRRGITVHVAADDDAAADRRGDAA